ncbi:MAG: hypothetical protein EYC70_11925 [Planctomycetota bacterium]|nr:MAG: hypothetical protein EYC70_11925 [Planctomycetota bacterium]
MAILPFVLVLLVQDPSGQRLVVTAQGAYVLPAGASQGPAAASAGPRRQALVSSPRWTDGDGGLAWACNDVAVGMNGGVVFASKARNNGRLSLYPQGASTPVFEFPAAGVTDPAVAVADRAGRAAALLSRDLDPDPLRADYQATLHVFDTAGAGAPEWSYVFPASGGSASGGVLLNDSGALVLAWKADAGLRRLRVEAFHGNGAPLSSALLSTTDGLSTAFEARQVRLGDLGRRAYLAIGSAAVIFDVSSGSILYQHPLDGDFDAHALSGDGRRFACGGFGGFEVWGESAPGTWTRLASVAAPAGSYAAWLDLDQDGSRCGYSFQRYAPAFDRIETGLYDVDLAADLFRAAFDAPGTTQQLASSGLEVDDRGEFVAGISWGESQNRVPEGFVYDAAGELTCSFDARGSALGLGFDPDGDVVCFGVQAVHAGVSGDGGDVVACDAQGQEMHVLGLPRLGELVEWRQDKTGGAVTVYVCDRLGASPISGLVSELDLTTLLRRYGPVRIPPGGLNQSVRIPNVVILSGDDVHVQGVVSGPSGPHLTNRATLQLVP